MIVLGETRREAINRVQERLGSATSRPLAEQTFWYLAKTGKITMNRDGVYLIEDITDDALRTDALTTIQNTNNRQRSKGNMRHFSINHNNTHRARVSTSWKAINHTAFAPSLQSAESYKPDANSVVSDN